MSGADQNALARLADCLFANPWCTAAEAAGLTGLPLWRVRETLGAHPEAFVSITLPRKPASWPRLSGRVHIAVHALSVPGQRALIGRFRSPDQLAAALLLTVEQLGPVRALLQALSRQRGLHWALSPWRPARKGMLLPALASLPAGPGTAFLAAFARPPQWATELWIEQLLREWRAWRRKSGRLQPAVLYLLQPPLEHPAAAADLARRAAADNEGLVFLPRGGQAWQILAGGSLSGVPPGLLTPAGFDRIGVAARPYPGSQDFLTWASAQADGPGRDLDRLLALGLPELAALEEICLHAPATLSRLKAGSDSARGRDGMRARVRQLAALGLVRRQKDGTLTVSPDGLSLLGGLAGISGPLADALLGWPNRPRAYAVQSAHYARITGFLLDLQRAGRLGSYATMKCRYRFREIAAGPVLRRTVWLHPDGEGHFRFSDGRETRFWLEVDRGSRRGARFSAQLEKYHQVRYARISPLALPVLLYIADTGSGRDEGRLRSAARRLALLRQASYPDSTLTVLFTTGELLDAFRGADPGTARIWRRFARGRLDPLLIDLETGLGLEVPA